MAVTHKHHIVPRHMGGSNNLSNLVELTVEEHAEAHRKLFEQHGLWEDEIAWKGLSGMLTMDEVKHEVYRRANLGRKFTDEHKQKIANARLGQTRDTSKATTAARIANLGKPCPEHVKKAVAASKLGKKRGEAFSIKMSAAMKGKQTRLGIKHTPEAKAKMSLAMKQRRNVQLEVTL